MAVIWQKIIILHQQILFADNLLHNLRWSAQTWCYITRALKQMEPVIGVLSGTPSNQG